MYRILIADDNSLIRMALANMIEWNKLGAELVASAHDGQEALKLCEELQPQIVITDIKMPGRSGLYLLDQINRQFPSMQTIVISAYDVFEYAKQAMISGCLNYILKPINPEELNSTIKKAISIIRKQKENQLDDDLYGLYRQMQNLQPEINDTCQIYIIIGRNLPSIELIKDNCCEIKNKHIFALAMNDVTVYMLALKKKAAEGCLSDIGAYFNTMNKGDVLYAVGTVNYDSDCVALQKSYEKTLGKAALQAFRASEQFKAGPVYALDNMEQETKVYWSIMNHEGMMNVLKSHLQFDTVDNSDLLENNRSTVIDFLKVLIQLSKKRFNDICKLIGNMENQKGRLLYTNIGQILDDINQLLQLMCEDEIINSSGSNTLVYRIKKVIDVNYSLNINMDLFTSLLSYSAVYISMVFKKETGMSITKYLEEVRMRKARELLEHTDIKVINISQLVGYNDYINFIKQFRKICGITPGKYRKNNRTGRQEI